MAYGQQDYGMGAEYGYETEEERRRREEEERQREIEMMANTGMGAAAPAGAPASRSLGDIAGAYMNKRVDQAQQRVADVGEMFTDPQAALEKRLGMTGGADTEPTPVKQTITTDPTTGEQKMKIEGSVRDLSAANPLTPTVSGPAVPTAMPPAAAPQAAPQQAAPQQAAPQPRPMPTPVPAQLPAAGPIDPNAPRPDIGQVPTPGPGVQVAGPATAVPPTTMAAAPAGGQTPAAVAAAPGASVAQIAQQSAQPTRPQWAIDLEAAGNDQDKLVEIAANKSYPQDVRNDAKEKLKASMASADAANQAQKTVTAAAQGEPAAQQKLLNSIKNSTIKKEEGKVTEGSYIRAYLYARLGLNDLAKEEQEKIMGQTEYGQVSLGKDKYEVTKNKKTGQITSARDNEGNPVDTPILNRIRAESLKISGAQLPSAGATRIRDSKGTEWSVVPTPQGSTFYNNKGEQGVPDGRTVPIAVGSDLEIAQAKEDMQTVAGFSRQTAAARLKAFENTNAKRADRLLPLLSLDEMGLRADGSLASEDVRRPGTAVTTPAPATPAATPANVAQRPAQAAAATPAPATPANVAQRPIQPVSPAQAAAATTPTTPLVSTQGPVAGGGGRTPAGTIPTAADMERQTKESDTERNIRETQIKDRNKSNQDYSDSLATSRQTAAAQGSTITRLQSSIDRNPEFWGIDTNSGAWRAFVDLNSTNADKAESLNTLARNLNIPKNKRAQFDQTMNDYRNLQVNAVTGSGLTASQTNTERESQRVMGTIGSISDRPAAAKATLEYAKAKIEYTDAKARAWADARRTNPGIDRLAFEANFDATTGEKIFKDANERMGRILGQAPGGTQEGATSTSRSGRPIVYRNGRWEYQ